MDLESAISGISLDSKVLRKAREFECQAKNGVQRRVEVGRAAQKKMKQIGANIYFVKFLLNYSVVRSNFPFPEPASNELRRKARRAMKKFLFEKYKPEKKDEPDRREELWAAWNRSIDATKKNSPSFLDIQIDHCFKSRRKGPPTENEVFHAVCLLERYFRTVTEGHPHWGLIATLVKPLSPRRAYSRNTLSSWVTRRRRKFGCQGVDALLVKLATIYNFICEYDPRRNLLETKSPYVLKFSKGTFKNWRTCREIENDKELVPNRPGIYAVCSRRTFTPLYVGRTRGNSEAAPRTIRDRFFRDHLRERSRKSALRRHVAAEELKICLAQDPKGHKKVGKSREKEISDFLTNEVLFAFLPFIWEEVDDAARRAICELRPRWNRSLRGLPVQPISLS